MTRFFSKEKWGLASATGVLNKYDDMGNILATLTFSNTHKVLFVSDNYIITDESQDINLNPKRNFALYDKNGSIIASTQIAAGTNIVYIDEKNSRIIFIDNGNKYLTITDLNFNVIKSNLNLIIAITNVLINKNYTILFSNNFGNYDVLDINNNLSGEKPVQNSVLIF